MELHQYLRILRKYLWMILFLCTAGTLAALWYSLQQPPVYKASTVVVLNPAAPQSVIFPFSPAAAAQYLTPTYIELLKTRAFASLVVKELNLPDVDEDVLLRSITAEGLPNTLFFKISATSTRREYAQLIANTTADVFIQQNVAQQQEQQRQISSPPGAQQEQQKQRLEDLHTRLEDENRYYVALIADLRRRIGELEALPSSIDLDRRVVELRQQLSQAQELNVKVLSSLADVNAKLTASSASTIFNTAIVIDQARLPTSPEPSRLPLNVLFAFTASLVLGIGGAIVLEYLDHTYKAPDELEAEYGMAALGTIGLLDGRQGVRQGQEKLVCLYRPNSAMAEAYRTLRTNIQFAMAGRPIRSLLVTSAAPAEGKSLTAANLAVSVAQAGQRVILVDLDLRRPSLDTIFNLAHDSGFTNLVLNHQDGLEAYLKPSGVDGLRLLTSGPLPPNPSEILGSARAAAILEQLAQSADLVILDSPPAATVSDAALIAAQVDAVLQVVQAGHTRREVVLRTRDILKRTGARVIGPVINRMKTSDLGYYYYYDEYRPSTPQLEQPVPVWRRLEHASADGADGNARGQAGPEAGEKPEAEKA